MHWNYEPEIRPWVFLIKNQFTRIRVQMESDNYYAQCIAIIIKLWTMKKYFMSVIAKVVKSTHFNNLVGTEPAQLRQVTTYQDHVKD